MLRLSDRELPGGPRSSTVPTMSSSSPSRLPNRACAAGWAAPIWGVTWRTSRPRSPWPRTCSIRTTCRCCAARWTNCPGPSPHWIVRNRSDRPACSARTGMRSCVAGTGRGRRTPCCARLYPPRATPKRSQNYWFLTFMLDREGPGSGRVFGNGRQGGPSGGSEATVARPSLPRTPSLKRLGPCLRADGPQGARLEVLLVALADDWLSKDLPALWRGGRCRAWPGPAAGGGSDRVSNWVPGTVIQLDRPPQQFPQDLNGSKGSDPHSKSRGSRESPWPVERIPINP